MFLYTCQKTPSAVKFYSVSGNAILRPPMLKYSRIDGKLQFLRRKARSVEAFRAQRTSRIEKRSYHHHCTAKRVEGSVTSLKALMQLPWPMHDNQVHFLLCLYFAFSNASTRASTPMVSPQRFILIAKASFLRAHVVTSPQGELYQPKRKLPDQFPRSHPSLLLRDHHAFS